QPHQELMQQTELFLCLLLLWCVQARSAVAFLKARSDTLATQQQLLDWAQGCSLMNLPQLQQTHNAYG
ncbi:MAG: hypothetical protein MUC47_05220, partial [Candidatus Kapabacteria bacterium]|nr:hypothetical protein [Candidatus Kapabacteria bacterium]